jgi:Zn finger protein HypA/HybF involved in hydrogenase expression
MSEYYCTKCKIKIESPWLVYVECPKCKSGSHIRDYDDCGEYDNLVMGGGDYNWNKR